MAKRETVHDLKKKNQNLKFFIGSLSHELRRSIGNAHLVLDSMINVVRAKETFKELSPFVNAAWAESFIAKNILNEVPDIETIEGGKMRNTRTEAFDVREFFNRLMETFNTIGRLGGMSLEVRIAIPFPPIITGDRQAISQILSNLLSNAFKYGERFTTVTLHVSGQADSWMISVTNFGRGIAAGDIDLIFEPYWRGARDEIQGAGLGLFVAKRMVKALGGKINVESEPNSFTRFTITLPLQIGEGSDAKGLGESDIDSIRLEGVHALIGEDDNLTSFLLQELLSKMGCTSMVAKDGLTLLETAMKLCNDGCPDVILLDSGLPDIKGEIVIGKLKKNEKLKNVPIIAVTGDVMGTTIERMLAAGASGYVKKPVEPDSLRTVMCQVLSANKQRE